MEMVTKTIQEMAEATPNPQALQFIIGNNNDILQMHMALQLPEEFTAIKISSIQNEIKVYMGQKEMKKEFITMIM